MKTKLDAARLRDALDYDPDTGIFRWRISTNRRIVIGSIAGCLFRGVIQIKFDGGCYRAHRLARLHVYGHWPKQQIDHKNGNPADNRISNLRDVSAVVNRQNIHRPQRRNKLGLLGVSVCSNSNKFRARVGHDYLGIFDTPQEAHSAYLRAKIERHEGYVPCV